MAGIKITDLPSLAVAEAADYLCIVDVSDTSESAAGTTKKIEVENLFESGTWTPTFSNYTDAISATALNEATYSRVGNIVTCSMSLNITFDFGLGDDNGSVDFTLPIPTTTANGSGAVGSTVIAKQFNGAVRGGSATLGRLAMQSADTSLSDTANVMAIFQYEIN